MDIAARFLGSAGSQARADDGFRRLGEGRVIIGFRRSGLAGASSLKSGPDTLLAGALPAQRLG